MGVRGTRLGTGVSKGGSGALYVGSVGEHYMWAVWVSTICGQ